MPVDLDKDSFREAVENNDIVIVDFWAPWCGPCQGFAPVYEKVAEDYPDITFAKVNTEEQQEIAASFEIRSIPTLMVFREQVIVFAQPGALPEGSLRQLLDQVKSLDMDDVRKQIAEAEQEQASS
jgi:thioredoxin 1